MSLVVLFDLAFDVLPLSIFLEVIVTLIPECIMISHNNPSMYKNFKIVPNRAIH